MRSSIRRETDVPAHVWVNSDGENEVLFLPIRGVIIMSKEHDNADHSLARTNAKLTCRGM